MTRRTTVFYIDTDPLRSVTTQSILQRCPYCKLIGTSADADVAVALTDCRTFSASTIILGHPAEGCVNLALIEQLAEIPSTRRIVVLTSRTDDCALHAFAQLAKADLLLFGNDIEAEITTAFNAPEPRERHVSTPIQHAMIKLFSDPCAFFKIFSNKELELLPHFGRGESDHEIGQVKGMAPLTVKCHRQHVMGKAGVHCTRELMRWAALKGFARSLVAT